MSLISQAIAALFNGVSQQPATIRLPSQAAAQVNGYPTVADGLRKRPPFRHVAKVTTADWSTAFIHTINRDVSERYIVVVTDGDIAVYDDDGAAVTVNFPEGKAYLDVASGTASTAFALVTVADYTFIVNKSVAVAMDAVGSDLALPSGWANFYQPTTWYSVPASSPDARYFNPSRTYRGVKQTFTDLPPTADGPLEGDLWKITGSDEGGFGSYYVRRTGGVWEESAALGISHKLNDATMPWALVRESDGEFYFRPFKWNVRKFGDDESNPPPTFVGRTINDVFFYKNRLAFVSDENVIFSNAGQFGQFFRTTVTDLLDADVVDVAVSATNVALLKFAVPFANNLMLFADQTQFKLNVDQLLTPRSVSIDTVTNYAMNVRARPVAIGTDVYFATESGEYSRIREYFVEEGEHTTDANDVTAHVPRYVPKGIFKMAGNTNEDVLFAISDAAGMRNRVYVYKFHWDGEGKAQSAWSYWVHGDEQSTILSIEVIENELYVLINRASDGVYLEKCNVQSGQTTGTLDSEVLLDRLADVTSTYGSMADETTFTLPYPVTTGNRARFRIVRGGGFTGAKGSIVDPSQYTWDSSTVVKVPGNHAGVTHVGQLYEFRYRFSEVFVQGREGAVTTGRFQIRTWVIYFTGTAFFQTSVAPYGTTPLVESIVPSALSAYTGKTLGEASLIIGEPNFAAGTYAFQVYGNSRDAVIELVNDTPVQSIFQSAEYEGLYHNRAQVR